MTWRDLARNIAYWTLPPGIENFIRRSLSTRTIEGINHLSEEKRRVLKRNSVFYDRHAGERCFILATGPSIKNQDLRVLQGEICIAVSNFFVHPDYNWLSPKYYCIAPFHAPITEAGWRDWLTRIDAATDADTKLFFGLSDLERNSAFLDRPSNYLLFGGTWDHLLADGLDLTRALPGPQSVPIMALYVAIYMGFKDIRLVGCDYDAILNMGKSHHFYQEDKHALTNHDYNEWSDFDLESECQSYVRLWQQFKKIKRIADHRQLIITNSTDGGLLDVFPRKPLPKIRSI